MQVPRTEACGYPDLMCTKGNAQSSLPQRQRSQQQLGLASQRPTLSLQHTAKLRGHKVILHRSDTQGLRSTASGSPAACQPARDGLQGHVYRVQG